ncbi:MAG: ATP-grasp domain-containing protein [Planctomycetales bacterium]|nr:ATP-grasp domain-containing protein [Planctomycetales bacterium]
MADETIAQVYLQSDQGVPSNEAFYKAWDGFRKRGVPCELFEPHQLHDGSLPLSRGTLVAGAIRVVESALETLGVDIPPADNLPACLAQYRGRQVRKTTWGTLANEILTNGLSDPLFVKSYCRNKAFPSIAVFSADDIAGHPLQADDEVLVAEYVVFLSEWRCFVCRDEILELCHYQGDPFCFPDGAVIRQAIQDFRGRAPAGYAIDFGVLTTDRSTERTVLVEVNEGYSLGPYGINSVDYTQVLEARWLELTAG